MMNLEEKDGPSISGTGKGEAKAGSVEPKKTRWIASKTLPDEWILSRYNRTVKAVTELLDNYDFGEAARCLYEFMWGDFCDWYVEFSKIALNGSDAVAKSCVQQILRYVLCGTLQLLHPFMPFITEEIYQKLGADKTLVLETWPTVDAKLIDATAEAQIAILQDTIRAIRNIRAEMNVPHGKKCRVLLATGMPGQAAGEMEAKILREAAGYIQTLAGAEAVEIKIGGFTAGEIKQAASAVVPGVQVYVPLTGLIDLDKEKERLQRATEKLGKELAGLEGRLQNKNFTEKAPPDAVVEARNRQEELIQEIKLIQTRISALTPPLAAAG
jgi:valyl-tRNA synthetase